MAHKIRYSRLYYTSIQACAFAMCSVFGLGCSNPEGTEDIDAGATNNGTLFDCGPEAPEPSNCHHTNFVRPENGWCQGFRQEADPDDPDSFRSVPVDDAEAESWSCVECLVDADCPATFICGISGECASSALAGDGSDAGGHDDVGIEPDVGNDAN